MKQQENRIHQLEAEIEVLKQHQCAELLKPIPNKHGKKKCLFNLYDVSETAAVPSSQGTSPQTIAQLRQLEKMLL